MKRSEIDNKYKWNTASIYTSMQAFDADFAKAGQMIKELAAKENVMCQPQKICMIHWN